MILCPQCQTINEVASTRCAGCGASLDGDAAALGSDPYIGRQLGDRFFLQSFLGSGEIGLVYRGTDVSTSAEVAVKIVHPDVAANIGDRLLRSAVAISQVRHAKLASVLAAAREPDGTLYIATEYLRGHTLKQMLEHNGPLGPRRAADILFQLASALAPIHKVGRPHANLKPENVFLVERDGSADFVRICDVGVPDLFGVRKSPQGAVIIGSPKYFSPEQAQGQAATVLSDQFTLGIIAYQLLTGALPFFGATPDQLLAAIAAGTPTPIARRTPGIQLPPKLEQIIQRCLSKTPGERYADLRALATDVAAVIKSTQPEAAPPRKKGFVQASTVMADPGMIGSLQASVEPDDDDDDQSDRTSVREVHWGNEKTGEHTPLVDDRTPAVSPIAALAATTRPTPPAPPPMGRPPRPPTQNDMMNVPPPLMVTGAIDSSDLQAALESATAAVGRPSAPPAGAGRRAAFDDDLQAALAAAAAEVGDPGSPPARRPATPDPFGGAELSGLNATPAGSAAALASAPSARPSSPGGVRLTHEIMSAIDEELVDASVSIPPQAGAPASPLATMDDLKELRRPVEGTAAGRGTPRATDGGKKAKLAAAGLLLVLGGGAGAYFLMGETPADPPPTRTAPPSATAGASAASPSVASLAPSAGPSAAAASVPPSGPATDAVATGSAPGTAAPSAAGSFDPDEPALVRKAREDAAKAAAAAAASGAPAPLPTSVSLTSDPPGATVLIGERKLGLTPMDVPIDPASTQVFTLRLDGFESAQITADPKTAPPGKPFSIATKLAPAGGAPAPAPATAAATAAPKPKPKPAPAGGSDAPAPKPKPKPAPKKPSAEVEDPFAE
jgi:serine/threonine protein kinase